MEIIKLNSKNLKDINKKVAELLKKGKVIVYPTDTVYGLICDARNKTAVKKIFKIKKRDRKKPLPLFVRDIKMAKEFSLIDRNQEKFLRKVWPGKTTAILTRLRPAFAEAAAGKQGFGGQGKKGEEIYGVDKKTIALRIPEYRPLNCLLEKINYSLAETSANISGGLASTKIKEVISQFKNQPPTKNGGGQPDLIIDGGILSKKSSTVIDLTKTPPKILRK